MSSLNKKYSNNDITVFWQPEKCIHSAKCARSLIQVFNPRRRPWVVMENGSTEDIVQTVQNCPSGALSFEYKS
ncbi:(4Fe-4S)-binding protein [Mucilaginibacter sp. HMF5004]|uniref:(4Fe-4S)-binding protein n=1 Tax=Mucilaginibacter rivuli TaxID=2857527 RepID=UPI001C5F6A56|nr:(4Fe-4S)-binding protein [Mucilaginibacter rivuli]MBW4891608.1 (4Fe-4S)-binding protein [Mucilaginibacter rivuli]